MFEHELRCRPNCPDNSSVDSHFSSFQGVFLYEGICSFQEQHVSIYQYFIHFET